MSIATDSMFQQVFSVGDTPRLSVNVIAGAVVIQTGDDAMIRVDVTGVESTRGRAGVECRQDGDEVYVRSRGGQKDAEYHIIVPAGCAIQLHSVQADAAIAGTRAPITVETVSGDLTLEDVAGECRLHSVGGDTTARRLHGALVLQTTNGDVTIRDSRLHRFNLHSTNGDFEIETPLTEGERYFAKTVNGDVRLIVPPDTGLLAQLRTHNGEIQSDLPCETINRSRRNWQARINGGGANVEMESTNGDLRIVAGAERQNDSLEEGVPDDNYNSIAALAHDLPESIRPPDAGFNPERSEQPNQEMPNRQQQSIDILAELEHGALTVEEAMKRLDELR
ncbi:MAG: DUF4097 domain-containing protein [Chloroflexota bacterium]|nr:DUF4097 domain-containing protein [Chloroflexota bacterium]